MVPFDDLENQAHAMRLIEAHQPTILREAKELRASRPAMRVAGLIIEPRSPEWAEFRSKFAQSTGKELPASTFVGIVPVKLLVDILTAGHHHEAALWIAHVDHDKMVAIQAITVKGHQAKAVMLEPSSLDDIDPDRPL